MNSQSAADDVGSQRLAGIALKVHLHHNDGSREAVQRVLHTFPDQSLRTFGVDPHQVESRPSGAEVVERGRWDLLDTAVLNARVPKCGFIKIVRDTSSYLGDLLPACIPRFLG